MRKQIVLVLALAAPLIAAAAASADRGSWNNWHVHDGTPAANVYTDENGLTHRPAVFFPAIFTGGNVAAYIADPSLWAYCIDATDKALAGIDGDVDGSKSVAGVCMNESNVIHLLAVPAGQSPPDDGWSLIPIAGNSTLYYKLTPNG